MSFASKLLNKMFKDGDDKRDAGLTTPDNIKRFDDIVYGQDPVWQSLDVYRPKDVDGKLPVIVSVHGGGWVYGDKQRYQYYCMSLAEHGFSVVNYSYRLAPKNKFPKALEDTNSVFHWVYENAEEYGFDLDNVFALGDSAGAHLLSLYCSLCTSEEYASNFSFKSSKKYLPKAIALNCGAYKVDMSKRFDMLTMLMKDFLPNKGDEKELKLVDAIENVNCDFPPCFVMTANQDMLKDLAPLMVDKLESLNVSVVYKVYGDENNMLAHVFHCDIRSESAKLCNKEECDFFKSYM